MTNVKPIGSAEGHPRASDGRCDRYAIYERNGDVLTVEYIGYRIGDVTWGLPLGGPGWSPPVRFTSDAATFATVKMFNVDG